MIEASGEKNLFSWIHLSDIHFNHGNERNQINQEMVLQSLITDITKTTENSKRNIPRPDAIFITGDIAYSGAVVHSDEYEKAKTWLVKIGKAVDLEERQIFVVPGNHDVQRNIYNNDDEIAMLIDHLRSGHRLLEWAIKKDKYYDILLSRIENYNKFARNFAPICLGEQTQLESTHWKWTIRTASGLPIHIIGLNTALLCQNDSDNGKLRMSLNQIKDIPDMGNNPSYVSIGLGHHPFEWLADGAEIEKWLRKKIHIFLSGHMHVANSKYYQLGGGGNLISVQAGAVHNEEDPKAEPDSFNYSAIVQKENGTIVLRVWNRLWSDKFMDFRDDPEFHPSDQPYAEFELNISAHTETPKQRINDRSDNFIPVRLNNFPFHRKNRYVSDSPPVIDVWVGRKEELLDIKKLQSGVITITGLGGQGKSALASKFLDEWVIANPRAFWDWRDCREQRERFHSQLIGIIEHWSDGNMSGDVLSGAEVKELVKLFFDMVGKEDGLIILDNVDHYVDVDNNQFTLGVAEFVKAALEREHKLTILITCRPQISYPSIKFQEIHLAGIEEQDAMELFKRRGVNTSDYSENVSKIYKLTDGHPLWLNLIATQIALQPARCEEIIKEIESGEIDNRAKIIMTATWKQLDQQQKTLLRYMTELSGPEEVDWIHDCVQTHTELKSASRFNRTFLSLQALNLIVETRGKYSRREYDLHPIVRSFIISEFRGKRERKPYQDGVLWVIDTYINKFEDQISIATPISDLEYYIKRAEISLKKDDIKIAISSLLRVGELLIIRGIPGELFRVGEEIMEAIVEDDHEKYIDQDDFHALNSLLAHTYVEYGRKPEALAQIRRYTKIVPKGTAQYVAVCDAACYVYWMLDDFVSAISWAKEGIRLKVEEHIDTSHDPSHTLGLALRDSGDYDAALEYFLDGYSLDEILPAIKDDTDTFPKTSVSSLLGNIGRCLQFQQRYHDAIRFFVESARLLEAGEDSMAVMNRGYAALWLGEIFEQRRNYQAAYVSYRKSEIIWSKRAPLRVGTPKEKASQMAKVIDDQNLLGLTEAGIERAYKKIIGL